ncbi:myc-type, basic helix-loop-helix (bHLH) domain-containing protein [Artemisia annua]|uniref:Myc-type, basic helix-loop-helix (BHLH) domain-containing protein n=1 Tax=Artemisia annua TaxID=35608 RepID=A0A2U1NMA6_ARTAN|nr:myc-type, basic helix-loop-helix (bHLH) domain-containing protein [Artemisia annua]
MFHQLPDLTSFENLNYPPSLPTFLSQPRKIPTSSAREKQQQKRRTLSEKTRALQKILPWDKKMDMGTLLEETYKYIKFLQAQVKVLELMPVDSSTTGSNFGCCVYSTEQLVMFKDLAEKNYASMLGILGMVKAKGEVKGGLVILEIATVVVNESIDIVISQNLGTLLKLTSTRWQVLYNRSIKLYVIYSEKILYILCVNLKGNLAKDSRFMYQYKGQPGKDFSFQNRRYHKFTSLTISYINQQRHGIQGDQQCTYIIHEHEPLILCALQSLNVNKIIKLHTVKTQCIPSSNIISSTKQDALLEIPK